MIFIESHSLNLLTLIEFIEFDVKFEVCIECVTKKLVYIFFLK